MSKDKAISTRDVVQVINHLSSLTASITGTACIWAVIPFANLSFGALASLIQQGLGYDQSFIQAFETGLSATSKLFLWCAAIAVVTHPKVIEGANALKKEMQSLASTMYGFFSTKVTGDTGINSIVTVMPEY